MANLPLFDSLPKFVLVKPTGTKTRESFFRQPFANLFTPVPAWDMTQYLEELGLITPEMAKEYGHEVKFDLTDSFLYNPACMHVPFMEALKPYFDIRDLPNTYDRNVPRRFLSMDDVNESVSLVNLLAHISMDKSIPDDQWILIAEDQAILNPEWPQRIEAILRQLVPVNRSLQAIVGQSREYLPESDVGRLKAIILSAEGNKTFKTLSKEDKDALRIYPHQNLTCDYAQFCQGVASPLGGQELEISNVFNYHRSSFFLINKLALIPKLKRWVKEKIEQVNYGKIHNIVQGENGLFTCYQKNIAAPEVIDLKLKDEYSQRENYPDYILAGVDAAGKEYTKLIPLAQPVAFYKDTIQCLMHFTPNSIAYANPLLAIHTFANNNHLLKDQDYVDIAKEQSKAVVFNASLNRFAPYGYDFIQPLRKYVFQGKHHLNLFPSFFAQRNTQDFTPVLAPNLEQWSLEQVDKAYYFPTKFARGTNHMPNLSQVEQTLLQRRFFLDLLADDTIPDDQWIVVAKDQTVFRPDWYPRLNFFLRWSTIRYPEAKILVAGYESPEAGFSFMSEQDPEKLREIFAQAGIFTPDRSWSCKLTHDFEALVANSFRYITYSFILFRKSIIKEKFAPSIFQEPSTYYQDRFADLIRFNATNVICLNPGLAVYRPLEQIHQQPKLSSGQELEALIDTSEMEQDPQAQAQELYRQAVTAPDAQVNPENYDNLDDLVNPIENINTIQAKEQLDLSPYGAEQRAKIAQEQPLFFGKQKPLSEYFAQLEPEQFAYCCKSSPKLDPQSSYRKAGFLPDLVAKVKKYVINLPSSHDRLQAFMRQNNVEDFIVHEAVWGKDLSEADKAQLFDQEKYDKRYNRTMHAGEYGCSLSHTQILRHALYDPELQLDDWLLIIEDDTRLNPDWYQMLNKVLHFVENNLSERVEIINGAQNQIPNFDFIAPKRFTKYHSIYSQINNYYELEPELGITLINRDFPAGAGFYLIRKSLLVKNAQRICGKIDWVADDLAQMYTFRPEVFAYVNPQLGFDDPNLVSILDGERVASIAAEKMKRRAIPITKPHPYVNQERLYVIQKSLSLSQINKKFPGFQVIKQVDYSKMARAEQEKLFDFAKFKEQYGRDITPEELNLTLAHQQAWEKIRDLEASDFTFHFIVEDDQTLAPNFLHQVNCLCEYLDTRLDLDTLLIQTSNSRQAQDFNKLDFAAYEEARIFTDEQNLFAVNPEQDVCRVHRKVGNGSGSYIMLKFVPSHMHLFLSQGRRFFLAEDYVLGMHFSKKSLAFAQPQVSIKP
ncbi:hypothetical protein CJP74_01595 [Psittacicella melopsittaci]|uniref:Glycosyl transferase family 25 domain-containing protein n=1 Tax=Psittacicella melopsittaci TaxID=2028576 RepID=A0A3A1Y8E7_9GAMM|nr:glycosyltransferase family 25 protein [Psittacicella melopsittaci]RIY33586.1 hypothetical protein CJP74_01595 [Psittacicella melopsittaci]